jgi:hypothetical protein
MLYWILFFFLGRNSKVCHKLRSITSVSWAYIYIYSGKSIHFTSSITEQHDVKVSVNDIVIKAVAVALRNVPEANGKDISLIIWLSKILYTCIIGGEKFIVVGSRVNPENQILLI